MSQARRACRRLRPRPLRRPPEHHPLQNGQVSPHPLRLSRLPRVLRQHSKHTQQPQITHHAPREAGILPSFAGIVVSDRYAGCYSETWQGFAGHQVCAQPIIDYPWDDLPYADELDAATALDSVNNLLEPEACWRGGCGAPSCLPPWSRRR
jgi:hypothetical protein